MTARLDTSDTDTPTTLDQLYEHAEMLDVTPGWVNRGTPIFWPEPTTPFVPAAWDYARVREALDAAGGLIDVALAERRNLVMRNPHASNNFATVRTLACAYQMILPGEVAPTHRHAPHAIRVMLDAVGTYSVVDGERVPMETGDVVLTPGGDWHGHGHDGDRPAYWFDALDIPLVHLLEPMRYEDYPDRIQPVERVTEQSPYRFAAKDIAARLDATAPADDGSHGPRIVLETPDIPSMHLTVERLAGGTATAPHRSNANRVFVVLDGEGETGVGERTLQWRRGDTFVVPTWHRFTHRAARDATLFAVSDEAAMRRLGYYRED